MKILIADDQELVRETIAAFLRQDPGFTVDIAADLGVALRAVKAEGPYDLVMLDYMMPGMNGLEGLAVMRAAVPGTAVAILSGTAPRSVAEQALAEGAAGFLPKTMSTKSLVAAARFMAEGEVYAPVLRAADRVESSGGSGIAPLTPRELDVLRRLCRGMANKEIARDLELQEKTIKHYMTNILQKLQVRNRVEAALKAREMGY